MALIVCVCRNTLRNPTQETLHSELMVEEKYKTLLKEIDNTDNR